MSFSTFTEVGLLDTRPKAGTITLPLTTAIPGRLLTLKDVYGNAHNSTVTLALAGSDTFEGGATTLQLNNRFEGVTLLAGSNNTWNILGGTQMFAARIGSLSTASVRGSTLNFQTGFISSLTVDTLDIGSNVGFINLGDALANSVSSIITNTNTGRIGSTIMFQDQLMATSLGSVYNRSTMLFFNNIAFAGIRVAPTQFFTF
jgi:hypothetical protein